MTLETLVGAKAFLIAAWFALLFISERLAPARPAARDPWRLLRNGGMWATAILASPLIVLPSLALAQSVGLWTRGPEWSGPLSLVVDILILDLFTYILHRAYHKAPVMWRLHAPHHFDRTLDASSAMRFHFGEVALSAALRVPMIVALAMPIAHVVVFEILLALVSIFHHSNLKLPPRVESTISRIFVTPSIHWVHHHAVRADTDSNYGGVFSFWDLMFGTRSKTQRTPDMQIGVEGVSEKSLPQLILWPVSGKGGR